MFGRSIANFSNSLKTAITCFFKFRAINSGYQKFKFESLSFRDLLLQKANKF